MVYALTKKKPQSANTQQTSIFNSYGLQYSPLQTGLPVPSAVNTAQGIAQAFDSLFCSQRSQFSVILRPGHFTTCFPIHISRPVHNLSH